MYVRRISSGVAEPENKNGQTIVLTDNGILDTKVVNLKKIKLDSV